MPVHVYIALGSNWGRREGFLGKARMLLEAQGVRILNSSSIYRTSPEGFRFQPSFLNQVLAAETALSPFELLEAGKRIERRLNRIRLFPNAPRTIDIDLLFYDNVVMDTASLTLPHPRLHERAFVLIPLAQMAPCLTHPVFGLSVVKMLERVDRGGVELWL
ncbi:MAG: 2-amino-4-hydroxy-6-hydroxymethyldihydropteridine diphosphokinase [candidate division WOR-3 bacterium]|nr:2-amino-4-hydroxy-6-hydroxymethyldihydropteridine diphosphokinase [candidate division WOR-3 bacterium]